MNQVAEKIDLNRIESQSFNVTYPVKRAIRLALTGSRLSRDQIVDRMNEIAVREGLRSTISKASLDNWAKDSDPHRLPSLTWTVIFCKAVDDFNVLTELAQPFGLEVINKRQQNLLEWAEADLQRRKATRRAERALAEIEDL
jgi:hypothetical protein